MEKCKEYLRKYLPLIAFCAAAFWLFYQIYPIIFATHDDMRNYTLVRRGMVFSDSIRAAKTGRISHLWNHHLLALPFRAGSLPVYKLIQFSALLFDIFAGWKLLRAHADRRLADLAAVLGIAWASISVYHNLLIAYALCHQIPIGFCFLSLYHFGNSLKQKSRKDTLLSCLFLLLALMIYEAFAAMILLLAVWSICTPQKEETGFFRWLFRSAQRIVPQLLTVGCYCIVYFTWQHIYPPVYDGIAMDLHEPFMSLYSLKTYALSFFPLWELTRIAKEETITAGTFLVTLLRPAAWVTAACSAAAFYLLLPRIKMEKEKLRNFLLLSGIGIFLPCVLTAVSEKYMGWTRRGTDGYLPSFYSYLFLVGFLLAAAFLLFRSAPTANRKRLMRVLLTVCVFFVCLTASAVNGYWRPHFAGLSVRYRNFDRVMQRILPDCDASWQICAPDNPGIHLDRAFTQDYLKTYNPENVAYIHATSQLDSTKQTVCFRSPEDYVFAVTGNVDEVLHTDEVLVTTVLSEPVTIMLRLTGGDQYTATVEDGTVLHAPEGKAFDLSVRPGHPPAEEKE